MTVSLCGCDGNRLSFDFGGQLRYVWDPIDKAVSAALYIDAGCFSVRCAECIVSMDALHCFAADAKKCAEQLKGTAEYRPDEVEDLYFSLTMEKGGQARISGRFENRDGALDFSFDTDQSFFGDFFEELSALESEVQKQR